MIPNGSLFHPPPAIVPRRRGSAAAQLAGAEAEVLADALGAVAAGGVIIS
jgi:hypothetical protein